MICESKRDFANYQDFIIYQHEKFAYNFFEILHFKILCRL